MGNETDSYCIVLSGLADFEGWFWMTEWAEGLRVVDTGLLAFISELALGLAAECPAVDLTLDGELILLLLLIFFTSPINLVW